MVRLHKNKWHRVCALLRRPARRWSCFPRSLCAILCINSAGAERPDGRHGDRRSGRPQSRLRADLVCSARRDSLAGMVLRICGRGRGRGHRRGPAASRRWSGRSVTATPGSPPTSTRTPRAGSTGPGGIVLAVPTVRLPLTSATVLGVLAAFPRGAADQRAADRTQVLAAGAEHRGRGPGRHRACRARRERAAPRVHRPQRRRGGQVFRVSRVPVLPRRAGEVVRVVDGERVQVWTEVDGLLRVRAPATSHFVWDSGTGVVHFGPRVPLPRRVGAPARRDPARRRARIEVTALPPRWRLARQRRRPHADA